MKKISATDVARNFSKILNQIHYEEESFVILRNNEAICQMSPAKACVATVAEFFEFIDSSEGIDDSFVGDLEHIQQRQPRLSRSAWDF